jgi:hypothetical protein
VHELHEPPSRRHSKADAPSLEVKENVAPVAFDGLAGLPVMVVLGVAVSIVQLCVAGVRSVLPAVSVARTSKVWGPSLRPL